MAIIGKIEHLQQRLNYPHLQHVFTYLSKALNTKSDIHKKLFNLPIDSFEKIPLEKETFAFLQVAITKHIKYCFIESHQKYVDFQLIVEGIEEMHYIDTSKLTVDAPYDKSKDLSTYKPHSHTSKFLLESGDLAVFFPEDGHIGLSMYKEPSLIRKVVIKVPLEFMQR